MCMDTVSRQCEFDNELGDENFCSNNHIQATGTCPTLDTDQADSWQERTAAAARGSGRVSVSWAAAVQAGNISDTHTQSQRDFSCP